MADERGAEAYWEDAARSRLGFLDTVPPLTQAERIKDVYERIDTELAAMLNALSLSKSRRNAIAPVSRLSPEILPLIFELHALEAPLRKDHLGWIEVTHVCRHWRSIAIDTAALWRNIFMHLGDEWVGTMLARAKATPVVFDSGWDGIVTRPMVGPIMEHLFHTHEVSIQGDGQAVAIIHNWPFLSPAKCLRWLRAPTPPNHP
ncbi:hypothetical protein BV25DRAFT_1914971 [Artomyces pyxidatus]|uniref:Uncharacterized protein n=1 Tax=Artomyces pyxidatus TaxID=48021 RepID=A0ACB8T573_9AGAM|nr:hypothetical protein BV25DRAFT_1914971 [Artomyces pyxidatus]